MLLSIVAPIPYFMNRINCHLICGKIRGHVKTEDQLGDIFTKTLNGAQVDYICNKLSMINIYAPAWE